MEQLKAYKKGNKKRLIKNFDWITLSIVTVIALFSVVILGNASAKPFLGDEQGLAAIIEKINFEYVSLQLMWFGIGLALMVIVCLIDYNSLGEIAKYIFWGNVLVLAVLLVFGEVTKGAQAWINFGERSVQPGEFCKISLILMLGRVIAKVSERTNGNIRLRDMPRILVFFIVPFILVAIQPDMGTALAYVCILFGMLFIAKVKARIILALVGIAGLAVFAALPILPDYMKIRLGIMDTSAIDETVKQTSDQVAQSKTMIGSGQLTGKGLFQEGSLTQLDFMSEKRTDFIFSVAAESVGFIGGVILMLLYFILLFRLLYIASRAADLYGTLLVIGVASMLAFHIVENLGMTMGVLPVTGVPLPFFSYGGSSMLTNMLGIGIVQNVALRRTKKTFEPKLVENI